MNWTEARRDALLTTRREVYRRVAGSTEEANRNRDLLWRYQLALEYLLHRSRSEPYQWHVYGLRWRREAR